VDDFVTQFWPSTIDGLAFGSIYALIALGYTMVYGVLRLINFAHSEIFMIGTFGALFVPKALGIDSTLTGWGRPGWPHSSRRSALRCSCRSCSRSSSSRASSTGRRVAGYWSA
jgi:hypothetical protein